MTKLLFDEQPILIDRTLARLIGFNESIVVQQVHYWIKINENKKQNFIENRYWTYNSIKSWHEGEFSFWSYDTVKRVFKSLEEKGILITGNFNREKWDQTKWYSLNYEKLNELHQCIRLESANGEEENAQVHEGEIPKPIPENSSENTKENSPIQAHCENTMKGDIGKVETPFNDLERLFNSICTSLPKINGIKNARRKAVNQRWREYPDIEFFKLVFERVEKSDFLSGRSGDWRGCCFDWIMKPSNLQKISEGNYDNKDVATKVKNEASDFDFTNL